MLRKEHKTKIVDDVGTRIGAHQAALFVDFKGIKTKPLEGLRHDLRGTGASMRIVRKTLLVRAVEAQGVEDASGVRALQGQVAVIFGDVLGAAKACAAFAKKEKAFKFLGGILDGRMLSANEATSLAAIPGRQELLGQLVYVMSSPMRGLAVTLNAIPRSLVIALNEIAKQKTN